MNRFNAVVLCLLGISLSAGFYLKPVQVEDADAPPSSTALEAKSQLEGTWKLVRQKWGKSKKVKPTKKGYSVIKIFTQGKVFFIYFNQKEFRGAGGGSYKLEGNTFTETLDYFSWDHSATGKAQTYSWTIEENVLHQTGLLESDKYEKYTIEEYYERLENGMGLRPSNELTGVWKYTGGDGFTSTYIEENKLDVVKIITPTYWHVVFTDRESGEFHGSGFGTYTLTEDQYAEHQLTFSIDKTVIGKTFDFKVKLDEKGFTQIGSVSGDQVGGGALKEHYARMEE